MSLQFAFLVNYFIRPAYVEKI
ncbi:hypothetical protein EMIT0P171_130071 [Pseudomonas sp. IT-P171]